MIIETPTRWLLAILVGWAALLAVFLVREASASELLGEMGIVERLTALLYLTAAVCAAVCVVRRQGFLRLFSAGWLLLSILCVGEETSWLQHELGYGTPEFMRDRNVQGEFNLHNLKGLHGGKFLDQDAAAPALRGLASAQNLFQMGFVLFFAALPALAGVPLVRRHVVRWKLPIPGLRMLAVIWVPIIVAVAFSLGTSGLAKDLAAELREMLYGGAFALFLSQLARTLSSRPISP